MRATAGHKTGSLFTRHRCQPVLRINCLDGGHPILKLWAHQPTLTSTHNHRGKKNHESCGPRGPSRESQSHEFHHKFAKAIIRHVCQKTVKEFMVPCHPASKLYTCFALKLTAFWAPAMSSMMLLPLTMPVVAIKKLRPDDKPDQCFSATCFFTLHSPVFCLATQRKAAISV